MTSNTYADEICKIILVVVKYRTQKSPGFEDKDKKEFMQQLIDF